MWVKIAYDFEEYKKFYYDRHVIFLKLLLFDRVTFVVIVLIGYELSIISMLYFQRNFNA